MTILKKTIVIPSPPYRSFKLYQMDCQPIYTIRIFFRTYDAFSERVFVCLYPINDKTDRTDIFGPNLVQKKFQEKN